MKQWRMRTTLMVSLLAVSLGLTATCLLIIRLSVQQEVRRGLDSDLEHSLSTFRNVTRKNNHMLTREAALLADLPSLKALMATQDGNTIEDGSDEFWKTSGSDFFALLSSRGRLYTYSNAGPALNGEQVTAGLASCMSMADESCMVSFGSHVYELSIQPLYFGPASNESQLGYVVIGYAIDQQVAREISDVAAADVAFLIDGQVSATTLPPERIEDLRIQIGKLDKVKATPQTIMLGRESYTAAASSLAAAGKSSVALVVLKSFGDLASPGWMSFPRPGHTLAIDFQNRGPSTLALMARLDDIVAEAGGALYPAKDGRMSRRMLDLGYARFPDLLALRDPACGSDFLDRMETPR